MPFIVTYYVIITIILKLMFVIFIIYYYDLLSECKKITTLQIYENVNSIPSQNVYVDDGGDSESSQYMRDILQVEEQSRCNQLKNKAAQNNIGKRWFKRLRQYITTIRYLVLGVINILYLPQYPTELKVQRIGLY